MTAFIRQVGPVWMQLQQLGLPVPPHALRNALLALCVGLAVATCAMLFVVRHEIIPETHRHGFEGMASAPLMAGFIFMLLLGEALG